jgi:hypothetical protein
VLSLRVYPELHAEHELSELHLVHDFGQSKHYAYKTLLAVLLVELELVVLEALVVAEAYLASGQVHYPETKENEVESQVVH